MTAGRRAVGVLAVALFAWWATVEGGYAPGAWYPGALLVLAALVAIARPRMYAALPREARWALAALAAFTLWSFCSIAWADARGDAWDGANRTLLYLTLFALFALLPWSAGEAAAGIAAFALATAAVGVVAFVRALAGDDATVFVDGRLAAPIGYENATAALFLAAFWAALLLAARLPEAWAVHGARPRAARGALLATAGLLLDLTILAQSRGSLIAGVATLALAFVLARDRRPLLIGLAAVGVATAAALPALLAPYEAGATAGDPELVAVAVAMAASAALLFAAGAWLDALERWIGRRRRTVAAAGGLAALAGVVLVLAAGPLAAPGGAADSRFAAGPGSGRYDFWRVAALEFARNPLTGVGADNFAHDYVRDRRHGEEPLYPHSLALRVLAQTGIVGAALLALFLGAVVAAVRRRPTAAATAALVAAGAWVAHGSIDWLWEMPAVAAPAMAGLGLAAGLGARPPTATARLGTRGQRDRLAEDLGAGGQRYGVAEGLGTRGQRDRVAEGLAARGQHDRVAAGLGPPQQRRRAAARPGTAAPLRRVAIGAAVAGVAGAAAGSYALPALAAREVEGAVREWDRDRGAALRGLERARRLNPLSDRAELVAGALARRAGDAAQARRAYTAALARDDRNWHAHVELALLDLEDGRRAAALERLARARQLNPREELIDAAARPTPQLQRELSELAIPGPIERRPVDCAPVLGVAAECTRERNR